MNSNINSTFGGTGDQTPGEQTPRPTPPARREVIQRWEGEGGRSVGASPEEVARVAKPACELTTDADCLEDEIMSVESPEGQPPSKQLRDKEWKWVGIVAACILIPGGLIVGALTHRATLLTALGLVGALAIAAFPVWTAGLMRAREHRKARREAEALTNGIIVDTHAVEAAKAVSNKRSGPMTA